MAIGGAPTPTDVLKFLRDFGIPAVEGYGLSEEALKSRATARETDALIIADIQRLCAENLAEYKIPRKIVIRSEAFELTSTMKVKRMLYKDTLDEGF